MSRLEKGKKERKKGRKKERKKERKKLFREETTVAPLYKLFVAFGIVRRRVRIQRRRDEERSKMREKLEETKVTDKQSTLRESCHSGS